MSDHGFVDHCLELLSPLGRASSRRLFGGHGLYVDGLCMAIVMRDTLYLKVDDAHRAAFEAARCRPFTFGKEGGEPQTLSYYTVPDEAMESPAEMTPWARRALAAAVASRARTPPRKAAAKKLVDRKPDGKKGIADKAPARKRATHS